MCDSSPTKAAHCDEKDLDHVEFLLDDEAYEAFTKLLDELPPPSDELRKLLLTRPPWEEPEDPK